MKKLFISLLTLLLIISCLPQKVRAEEEIYEEGSFSVVATFDVATIGASRSLTFEFNDKWFTKDATEYNHKLARLSLGMAVSAFRPKYDRRVTVNPAQHLQNFLERARFTDLRTDDYDKNPSLYTVSTVMGHKAIKDEQGEFQLIVVGVCGGGYTNEWLSNFTVGLDSYHIGFYSAAKNVFDRLFGYIARNGLQDQRLKVWVSGYSRAAAVSNVFAQLVTDTEMFDNKDVFAYTFATPRTTVVHEEGDYPNIYNICGKYDPVPYLAFADWGYDRFGTTLYTPAQQTDTCFSERFQKAAEAYYRQTGIQFWTNAEWDNSLKSLLDYIIDLAPIVETYTYHMQDRIIDIWSNRSVENVMTKLMEMANDPALVRESNKKEANKMMTFLMYTLLKYVTNTGLEAQRMSAQATILGNLAHEHTPDVYLAWMFSDIDPNNIFTNAVDTIRITIYGDVDVAVLMDNTIYSGLVRCTSATGDTLQTFDYLGVKYGWGDSAPSVYMERNKSNNSTVVVLPKDETYRVAVKSNVDNQTVNVVATGSEVGYTGDMYHTVHTAELNRNDCDTMISTPLNALGGDGTYKTVYGDDFDYDESSGDEIERFIETIEIGNALNLTWQQIIIIIFSIPVLVFILLGVTIMILIGKHRVKRKKKLDLLPADAKYDKVPVLCIGASVGAFLLQELLYWLMPEYSFYRSLLKLVVGALTTYLCYRGYKKQPTLLSKTILFALIFCTVADIAINYNFGLGMFVYGVAQVILVVTFFKYDKPDLWQWIVWAAMTALSVFIIFRFGKSGTFSSLKAVMCLYSTILMAQFTLSLNMPKKIRFASILLVASNIVLFINEIRTMTLYSHVISLGVYYLAIIIFAFSTKYKPALAEKEETKAA